MLKARFTFTEALYVAKRAIADGIDEHDLRAFLERNGTPDASIREVVAKMRALDRRAPTPQPVAPPHWRSLTAEFIIDPRHPKGCCDY